jgi:hypothetical protein
MWRSRQVLVRLGKEGGSLTTTFDFKSAFKMPCLVSLIRHDRSSQPSKIAQNRSYWETPAVAISTIERNPFLGRRLAKFGG